MADAPQGEPREVSREEARKLVEEGAQLVDVRADHEWNAGHIAGAKHVPLPELPRRTGELDQDRPVVVYCRGGNRSSMVSLALTPSIRAARCQAGPCGLSGPGVTANSASNCAIAAATAAASSPWAVFVAMGEA